MSVVSIEAIQMMKDALVDPDVPRRRGKEWLGVFIGGGALDSNYELDVQV